VYTGSYFIHKLYGGQGLLIILWIYAIAGNQWLLGFGHSYKANN